MTAKAGLEKLLSSIIGEGKVRKLEVKTQMQRYPRGILVVKLDANEQVSFEEIGRMYRGY